MLIDQRLRPSQLHSTCRSLIYIYSSFTIVLVSSFLSSKLLSCSHLSDSGCLSSHCLLSLFFVAPFYLDMVALYNELGQAPVVPIQAWLGCNVAFRWAIRFSVWLLSIYPFMSLFSVCLSQIEMTNKHRGYQEWIWTDLQLDVTNCAMLSFCSVSGNTVLKNPWEKIPWCANVAPSRLSQLSAQVPLTGRQFPKATEEKTNLILRLFS